MPSASIRNSKPGHRHHAMRHRDGPSVDETLEEENGLELPVDPDEGMPIIPDDERVVDVPS